MTVRQHLICKFFSLLGIITSYGCAASTADIPVVTGFEPERYLGIWYEIARLPNRFEKDMNQVTAEYRAMPDGRIRVTNRGTSGGKSRHVSGKAKFTRGPTVGELKVTFFPPFSGSYRIIELASDYSSAIVTGDHRGYLWILARKPQLPESLLNEYRAKLEKLCFDTARLEYPRHDIPPDENAAR